MTGRTVESETREDRLAREAVEHMQRAILGDILTVFDQEFAAEIE